MATQLFTDLTNDWLAAKKYTAAADVDCRLTNPSGEYLFFDIVTGAGDPPEAVRDVQILGPKQFDKFQLKNGDTIHFGGSGAKAALLAVLT